ncbi:uncharacterized protein LOC106173937 [Lingula anatina]|uniref:Uncharacterized protein LOC106173937 n=1 Tax=Lingula anatina TaxID=7574 RepID=A0A1S3JKS8_LINAN|nr:uncharacterized protein LOC106173937 [Lingula anatina]|eukprot:XP_013410736.1 uncharacterized protein LOC106173937 [Lingula anatina]
MIRNKRTEGSYYQCIRHCSIGCCVTMMSYVFLIVSVIVLLIASSISGPLHASCKATWTFGEGCADVNKALVDQINKWKGPDGCKNGGEKCLYALKSSSATEIKATHETPKKHYVDDVSFEFSGSGSSCTVKGYSTSETWYAVLDYGTNYCNMFNLIQGAGLDKVSGYKEETSDSICTQRSSANCEIY